MLRNKIKNLNGDAARLLLALLTWQEPVTIVTLPDLIEQAGLTTHGKNRYGRAYQQLHDLGFLTLKEGSIRGMLEIEAKDE